jgi:hypothetical protein
MFWWICDIYPSFVHFKVTKVIVTLMLKRYIRYNTVIFCDILCSICMLIYRMDGWMDGWMEDMLTFSVAVSGIVSTPSFLL